MGFFCTKDQINGCYIWALQDHSSIPINFFSDSACVYGVVHYTETSTIHAGQDLFHLFTLSNLSFNHAMFPVL